MTTLENAAAIELPSSTDSTVEDAGDAGRIECECPPAHRLARRVSYAIVGVLLLLIVICVVVVLMQGAHSGS